MLINSGNSIMLEKTATSTDRQKDFVYKFLTMSLQAPTYSSLLTLFDVFTIFSPSNSH